MLVILDVLSHLKKIKTVVWDFCKDCSSRQDSCPSAFTGFLGHYKR